MCASVQKATAGPRVTTRMTPAPAPPSSVTRGSAISQIEGSPTACASLALVGSTASKVGPLCAGEGGQRKPQGAELDFISRLPTVPSFQRGDCMILQRCFLSFSSFTLNMGATPYISAAVGHCCVTN